LGLEVLSAASALSLLVSRNSRSSLNEELVLTISGLTAMLVTTNWAVGTFAVSAIGMYQWCQYRRREEGKGMVAAVKGMQLLNEKKAKERAIAEAAEKAAEEERQRNKNWWKVWQS
jgi:ribosomal protein S12 methylthiotransferase accessory factor YcaO